MTGQDLLNIVVGSTTVNGLLDKSSDDAKARATALNWGNIAINDIAQRQEGWHWRWLEKSATFPTVVSQLTYDLPTDIDLYKVFSVRQKESDVKLKFIPQDRFDLLIADPSVDSGNPTIYTLYANAIRLYPVPSTVITMYMRYIKTMTAMDDEATAIDIPDKYKNVVIDGMLVYGYKFDPEMGDWAKQQQIYELGIERMKKDNSLLIDESTTPLSHRAKYGRTDSGLYPTSNTFA